MLSAQLILILVKVLEKANKRTLSLDDQTPTFKVKTRRYEGKKLSLHAMHEATQGEFLNDRDSKMNILHFVCLHNKVAVLCFKDSCSVHII